LFSEILLCDPRGMRTTRPLPCEEDGGRHLGFLVVGVSDSAAARERGDGNDGGGHRWQSRGCVGGDRGVVATLDGGLEPTVAAPTIEVKV
jgi:hypothetical protein